MYWELDIGCNRKKLVDYLFLFLMVKRGAGNVLGLCRV